MQACIRKSSVSSSNHLPMDGLQNSISLRLHKQRAIGSGQWCAWCAGDMPVALMFDGPSLGGFVCPATITSTQLWKMGQVSAKDQVLFKSLTLGKWLRWP